MRSKIEHLYGQVCQRIENQHPLLFKGILIKKKTSIPTQDQIDNEMIAFFLKN